MNETFPFWKHNRTYEEQVHCVADFLKRHVFNRYSTNMDFEHFVTLSFMVTKELPFKVIKALEKFRRGINDDGVLVIRGLPIEESWIGPRLDTGQLELRQNSTMKRKCILLVWLLFWVKFFP